MRTFLVLLLAAAFASAPRTQMPRFAPYNLHIEGTVLPTVWYGMPALLIHAPRGRQIASFWRTDYFPQLKPISLQPLYAAGLLSATTGCQTPQPLLIQESWSNDWWVGPTISAPGPFVGPFIVNGGYLHGRRYGMHHPISYIATVGYSSCSPDDFWVLCTVHEF